MKTFSFLSWLLAGFLILTSLSFASETDTDRLLDLLVEKGTVTIDDAAGLRANLAIKNQEEKEAQKEFALIAGKPIKISGYTQVRFKQDKSSIDGFDVRRARLDFKGDVTERFDYRLQTEFAGASVKLIDAIIGYKFNSRLKFSAGQFLIPISLENISSNLKLETINRSQVVEALAARGKDIIGNQNGRDIGIQFAGTGSFVDYTIGAFNGSGVNTADTNRQKDIAGRLVFHPNKDILIGGSYYSGKYFDTTASANTRDRAGADISYTKNDVSLKAEYLKGKDSLTKRAGWYAQAGYYFIPKKFQNIIKYDSYDPNTSKDKDETKVYTYGINWFFDKSAFVQVNYELKDEAEGKEKSNNVFSGQLTLQF